MGGGTKKWVAALKSIGIDIPYIPKNTVQTYEKIKNLGYNTVDWIYIGSQKLEESLEEIKSFITKNKPCLFIYDPIREEPNIKKDYLFGVKDIAEIDKWIEKNHKNISSYEYLVTTQIQGLQEGFIGTVLSNGKGKMIIETIHEPYICNHRILSQEPFDSAKVSQLIIDNTDDSYSINDAKLSKETSQILIKMFETQHGYFEIIKGIQKNKTGIYVTGYETTGFFEFPENLHVFGMTENITHRLKGSNYNSRI
ncbi:MAG: hypothetical protein ACP5NV_05705 [Candidatus Woesearchaeota archaeon]